MNAQQALDILSPIDSSKFITGRLTAFDSKEFIKCCSVGFLNKSQTSDPYIDNKELRTFYKAVEEFLFKTVGISYNLTTVNDLSNINGYREPLPKDRVIHLLNDMIKAGL